MGDQETYPLIPQLGELDPRNMHRVQPARDDDEREQKHGEPLHGASASKKESAVDDVQVGRLECGLAV